MKGDGDRPDDRAERILNDLVGGLIELGEAAPEAKKVSLFKTAVEALNVLDAEPASEGGYASCSTSSRPTVALTQAGMETAKVSPARGGLVVPRRGQPARRGLARDGLFGRPSPNGRRPPLTRG